MEWSIDWVSIRQHHQDIDNRGDNIFRTYDGVTGDLIGEGVGFFSHEGSFSTSVSLRASGGVVEWSGNPSRWGRPDNIWGYSSLRECLEKVINPHLEAYGLPPFTIDTRQAASRQLSTPAAADGALDHGGAVLTRVDLCRNRATGSAKARDVYLRAASCAVYRGQSGTARPGSVTWGSRRNLLLKMYDKASELRAHMPRPGLLKNPTLENRRRHSAILEAVKYRHALADWCDQVGLVRQEVQLGRQALRQMRLRELGDWNDFRAAEIAAEKVDAMKIGCSADLGDSLQAFLDAGYSKRKSATLSGVVSSWYMGQDVESTVSRATWYRYCADVGAVLGLDLRQRPDLATLTARVQVVDLAPVDPPSWYRHAA